jgi:hypothetical protein
MPYLVTDNQPAGEVDYYEVELDGAIQRVDAARNGQDAWLHHDVSGVAMGQHSARIRAVNEWGSSGWTDPFVFVKALPPRPSGVGLSVE